jgi:transcriptional regulator with XRE-family HTH domain
MAAIRLYREKAGLTQAQLAFSLGVTQAAVAMWESGDRKPDIFTLKRIAQNLNCTTDDLLEVTAESENSEEA